MVLFNNNNTIIIMRRYSFADESFRILLLLACLVSVHLLNDVDGDEYTGRHVHAYDVDTDDYGDDEDSWMM